MMKGQIYENKGDIQAARDAYSRGTRSCPKSIPLWILSSRLEEKAGVTIKARAILERARMQNPKNEELWAESIRVEERSGTAGQAKAMLARGELERSQPVLHNPLMLKANFHGNSSTRLSDVWSAMEYGNLDGSPSTAERSLGGCHQKVIRAPIGNQFSCSAVLGRAQDREGTVMAQASGRRRQGQWRLVGMVAQV
jgi:pre-mRNA-processing factor 6